ncbi:MAG: YkgJ family cysteine cluster protein [Clostridia bacterium]|nr:YkgJ family cysteine cluster protein [Clostridia bacterium]
MAIQPITMRTKLGIGFDLEVTSELVTIQDYLDTVNSFIEKEELTRTRQKISSCEGCPRCCSERIPLTGIDVDILRKGLGDLDFADFINRYCHVLVDGPAVDIMLAAKFTGECIFLRPEDGRCANYTYRPLVCQTFICCPTSPRADKLRELVVNLGEDELVRRWFREGLSPSGELIIHEAWDPDLNIDDWQANPFTGKEGYQDVLLKDLCPDKLWKSLWK